MFAGFFFFQAEDGIRDHCVTGVQTCALPILIPIVFWESLLPWLKDILPADTSCSSRNALSTRRGSARRNSHDSPTVSTKATVSPRSGDTTMNVSVEIHLPGRTSAAVPAFAIAEPA